MTCYELPKFPIQRFKNLIFSPISEYFEGKEIISLMNIRFNIKIKQKIGNRSKFIKTVKYFNTSPKMINITFNAEKCISKSLTVLIKKSSPRN